ncbi:oleate hydratase [Sphingobacterium multivorum]|uniref:oleate hydratase n=1 Tax=Sphingobacterium multivorum TaxID=28454 RepID=UPI003519D981
MNDRRYLLRGQQNAPIIGIDNSSSGQSAGWKLWKNLAAKSAIFGKPEKFCSNIEKSAWESATLTCKLRL